MKKVTKWFLVLAAAMLAVGLVLRTAGFAMGGRRESRQYLENAWNAFDWKWNKPWGPVNIDSDGIHVGGENGIHVDSDGVSVGGDHGIHVGHHSSVDGKKELVESGELTGVTGIEIEVDCGDVWILEGEGISASLSWNLSNYTMNYRVEDGVLKVDSESGKSGHFGFQGINCTVIVTVPEGTALEELKVATDMGDIKVDAAVTARKAELSTDLGDVECKNLQAAELEAESDLGNVELHLPGGREEYRWELETNMGELTVGGEKQSGGMGNIASQGGSGQNKVDASSSLGNVELRFLSE